MGRGARSEDQDASTRLRELVGELAIRPLSDHVAEAMRHRLGVSTRTLPATHQSDQDATAREDGEDTT